MAVAELNTGFPGGSAVKNPPATQAIWVGSMSQEDALEKEMAIHSSLLACEILWTKELQSMGSPKSQTQLGN